MSNQKYCHNCGVKLVLLARFCPECGTSQASLSAKPPESSKPKPQTTFAPMARGDDDDDEYDSVDNVDVEHIQRVRSSIGESLAIELTPFERANRESFATVINQGAALPKDAQNFSRPIPPPMDAKMVLEDFKNSCRPAERL